MAYRSLLFMIYEQNFHMTSTRPIPLYSPSTLGIITIVVHVSAAGIFPFRNANFVTLTSLYHPLVSGSFSCVDYLIQTFKLSALIPGVPPYRLMHITRTETVI